MEIVIIGNSVGAINAIEAIREHDKTSNITIVSDETYKAYSHPLLPDLIVENVRRSDERFYYRRGDIYSSLNINTILGKKALSLDSKNDLVNLDDGRKLHYNKLILACGGHPFVPPMEGVDIEGVHTMTTIKGADRIKKDLDNIKSCVVVGGGLIGTKIAEKLAHKGIKVTVVELMKRVLFPVLDDKGADYIHKELENMGVDLVLGDSVTAIKGDSRVREVVLSSGKIIKTDAAIVAVGVRPNIDLTKDMDINTNRGIVVDEYMRTNIDNIYAVGDAAEAYDIVVEQKRPIPIIPIAAKQGRIAGLNIAGMETEYKGGFPLNSITIGNTSFISMGTVDSEDLEILSIQKDDEYRKFLIQGNRLVGMILINNIERSGMFSWMIENRFDVSWLKDTFLNSDFGWQYFNKAFRMLRLDRKIV